MIKKERKSFLLKDIVAKNGRKLHLKAGINNQSADNKYEDVIYIERKEK